MDIIKGALFAGIGFIAGIALARVCDKIKNESRENLEEVEDEHTDEVIEVCKRRMIFDCVIKVLVICGIPYMISKINSTNIREVKNEL